MIWLGDGKMKVEENEPALRSCWKCNPAHERLKTVNWLHCCFSCGKYWIFDRFLDSFKSDKDFDNFFTKAGLKKGESTTMIDKGYRISAITIKTKGKVNK